MKYLKKFNKLNESSEYTWIMNTIISDLKPDISNIEKTDYKLSFLCNNTKITLTFENNELKITKNENDIIANWDISDLEENDNDNIDTITSVIIDACTDDSSEESEEDIPLTKEEEEFKSEVLNIFNKSKLSSSSKVSVLYQICIDNTEYNDED
jgi:hypothetical protein